MPINIPSSLPAHTILTRENVFVMSEDRAQHQDIRPLRVAILNLMPTKIQTETQLLRLLGNSSLQVEATLLHTAVHSSMNTNADHLLTHYETFEGVRDQKFDGLVITGAPVENLPFEEVDYWPELCQIMDWAETNVYSTFYIAWGAQAGLYHRYGVPKYLLPTKIFGVFEHHLLIPTEKLFRGFDDVFLAPHSRYTEIRRADLERVTDIQILSVSDDVGIYITSARNGRHIFVTGNSEFDPLTLKDEYDQDIKKGLPINIPYNYFPNDDPSRPPQVRWRVHANLLFGNWLNYYVYQVSPFDVGNIPYGATPF